MASVSPIYAPISSNATKAATIRIGIIHSRIEAVETCSKKNEATVNLDNNNAQHKC